MKKKINFKVLIGILLILLFLCFIVYKFSLLQKYKTENIVIDNKAIFNETMNVKYNKNNDTIVFDEMSYFDYFSDYVNKENVDFKLKYNENGYSFFKSVQNRVHFKKFSFLW